MIVGNGMVAQRFNKYMTDDRFAIFASGISNSKTTKEEEYQRESDLLKKIISENKEKVLVYFSTCGVYDPAEKNSRYVQHKQSMEALISQHQPQYRNFRVSNLVGRSANPNTIMNYFFYHIRDRKPFDLWIHSYRNLIDVDDMYRIVDYLLHHDLPIGPVVNISNPASYPVSEIVREIEKFLGIPANIRPVEKGSRFDIDVKPIEPAIALLDIHFTKDYLPYLLHKYYSDK